MQVPPTHIQHNRQYHPQVRSYYSESILQPNSFIYPLFISNIDTCESIHNMPNQYRWPTKALPKQLDPLIEIGLSSVILFGVIKNSEVKCPEGKVALTEQNPVFEALRLLSKRYPEQVLIADVCQCSYTSHGHCCICNKDGSINNNATINLLGDLAVKYAQNGAHIVAPSDMMDGRVGCIKNKQQQANQIDKICIMSYAAKFSSCLYGPFRSATNINSSFGNRNQYQLPIDSTSLAINSIRRDIEEGTDFVIVKPATLYQDIIKEAKKCCSDRGNIPVVAYHVSGEYSSIYYGVKAGLFNLEQILMESMLSLRRAGATLIITYYVPELLNILRGRQQQCEVRKSVYVISDED